MANDFARLTLTRLQQRLLDTATAIRSTPPDRIDFLHTVQCQCGIPYKNPGDDVRDWERKQGNATLHIEAGDGLRPLPRYGEEQPATAGAQRATGAAGRSSSLKGQSIERRYMQQRTSFQR